MPSLTLRVSDDELSAYDEARGAVPRNAWMRAVLNRYVDVERAQDGVLRPVAEPVTGVQAVTPAAKVGPPTFQPALEGARSVSQRPQHRQPCGCAVCKPPRQA